MFVVFLLASTSALPEVCFSNDIYDMNCFEAVRLTSYCVMEFIIEEANLEPEDDYSEMFCGPGFLYEMEDQQEQINMFVMKCLMQAAREPGDVLPLGPQIIKQRIASASKQFLNEFKDDDCTPEKLKEVSYLDALGKEAVCMAHQTLKFLSHPEHFEDLES